MLDLSLAEILLVVVVVVVFMQPKDLPVVVRAIAKFIRTIRDFSHDIKQAFEDIAKEAGVDDIKETLEAEIRLIQGDDGKMYESYQIPSIENDIKKTDDRKE
jgi:Tat protein translocase TatB subunit